MEHINFHEVNDNASKDDYTYIAHSDMSSEDASEKDIDSDAVLAHPRQHKCSGKLMNKNSKNGSDSQQEQQ